MNYLCPVCGFNQLPEPPVDYLICPCCGTEFGYTDFNKSHETLYLDWLAKGMKWHSALILPPAGWNPYAQIAKRKRELSASVRTVSQTQIAHVSGVVIFDRVQLQGQHAQLFGNMNDLVAHLRPMLS